MSCSALLHTQRTHLPNHAEVPSLVPPLLLVRVRLTLRQAEIIRLGEGHPKTGFKTQDSILYVGGAHEFSAPTIIV